MDAGHALEVVSVVARSAETAQTHHECSNNRSSIAHLRTVLVGNLLWGSSGVVTGVVAMKLFSRSVATRDATALVAARHAHAPSRARRFPTIARWHRHAMCCSVAQVAIGLRGGLRRLACGRTTLRSPAEIELEDRWQTRIDFT
jgi:hypothetical protein